MFSYILYLIIGAIGGLLVGLIGCGIGPIVIPALMFILINAGVDKDLSVHLAIGTSLCVVLVTTLVTLGGYRVSKLINEQLLIRLLPGTLLGALFGSAGSAVLSGRVLELILGCFMIVLALYILSSKRQASEKKLEKPMPGTVQLTLTTLVLSCLSTVLGISDGIFLIPFLSTFNFPIRTTIATATVCAFAASLVGAIPYLLIGLRATNLPEHTVGYVFLPAFFAIILTSSLFSPIGVYLNKHVSEEKLKTVFALFMICVGTKILFF